MYDVDHKLRKQIRKAIQQDVRMVRRQMDAHRTKLDPSDGDDQRTAAHLQLLDDYALATQTALNVDALQPFKYASPVVEEALDAIAASLTGLEKGALPPPLSRPNGHDCSTSSPATASGATS